MSKKILLLAIILLMLAGCSKKDFATSVSDAVDKATSVNILSSEYNNCTKEYYSYYRSTNVGKTDSNELSNEFMIEGNVAALNLDVASIVINQIYDEVSEYTVRNIGTIANAKYTKIGQYVNSSGVTIPYKITISDSGKNVECVLIQTSEFLFISFVANGTCATTIYDMLVLLRSCKVNSTQVILDYGSDNIVYYNTNIITLFEDVLPESGYVIDYLDQWQNDTSFIVIDNTEQPQEEYDEEDLIEGEDDLQENQD